jgi:hypothetical protein
LKHTGTGGEISCGMTPAPLTDKSGNMKGKPKQMSPHQMKGTPKGSITRGK